MKKHFDPEKTNLKIDVAYDYDRSSDFNELFESLGKHCYGQKDGCIFTQLIDIRKIFQLSFEEIRELLFYPSFSYFNFIKDPWNEVRYALEDIGGDDEEMFETLKPFLKDNVRAEFFTIRGYCQSEWAEFFAYREDGTEISDSYKKDVENQFFGTPVYLGYCLEDEWVCLFLDDEFSYSKEEAIDKIFEDLKDRFDNEKDLKAFLEKEVPEYPCDYY